MNLAHPHFAEPQWLWLAVCGPLVLFALQRYSAWMRHRQLRRLASEHFLDELTRSHSAFKRELKNVLLLMALAAAGLALARPQWGQQQEKSEALGDDVVFIVDCSRSMLAADVRPSRLQRSKLAVLDFMRRHTHSRLGLVAFAGQAFLQCPLTFDYASFEDALMALDDKTIPIAGTDIATALDEAVRALDKGERRKLFVLITDGEDLEKGGIRMAEKLAKEGVTIFTIGVGTPAGAQIEVANEQGKVELLRDSKGQVVTSRLDEPTLKAIAEVTKGAYYPLGMLGEGLAKVRLALEGQTHWTGAVPNRTLGVDRFHIFIAMFILLLIGESVVGTRKLFSGATSDGMPRRVASSPGGPVGALSPK